MVDTLASEVRNDWSTGNFVRHFVEMVVAMMVGMMVLGGISRGTLAVLEGDDLNDYAGARALLMTVNMTIGMVLWMRYRQHHWVSIGEMSAAMVVPFVVLIGPYEAGVLSDGALFGALHALMLPCMLAVMLIRRSEYGRDHRSHSASHAGMHGV